MSEINFYPDTYPDVVKAADRLSRARAEAAAAEDQLEEARALEASLRSGLEQTHRMNRHGAATLAEVKTTKRRLDTVAKSAEKLSSALRKARAKEERAQIEHQEALTRAQAERDKSYRAYVQDLTARQHETLRAAQQANVEAMDFIAQMRRSGYNPHPHPWPVFLNELMPVAAMERYGALPADVGASLLERFERAVAEQFGGELPTMKEISAAA